MNLTDPEPSTLKPQPESLNKRIISRDGTMWSLACLVRECERVEKTKKAPYSGLLTATRSQLRLEPPPTPRPTRSRSRSRRRRRERSASASRDRGGDFDDRKFKMFRFRSGLLCLRQAESLRECREYSTGSSGLCRCTKAAYSRVPKGAMRTRGHK